MIRRARITWGNFKGDVLEWNSESPAGVPCRVLFDASHRGILSVNPYRSGTYHHLWGETVEYMVKLGQAEALDVSPDILWDGSAVW